MSTRESLNWGQCHAHSSFKKDVYALPGQAGVQWRAREPGKALAVLTRLV